MAEVELKDWVEEQREAFARRASSNGRTVELEIESLLKKSSTYSPEERLAVSQYFLSRYRERQPSLTLDEIREGLM